MTTGIRPSHLIRPSETKEEREVREEREEKERAAILRKRLANATLPKGVSKKKFMQKYVFPHDRDKTPLDYLTDPATGGRGINNSKPSGIHKVNLRDGIPSYAVIPPLGIWEKGVWFVHLSDEAQKEFGAQVRAEEEFDCYCVQGEGTPGGYLIRLYLCPDEISSLAVAPHPLDWPENLRVKKTWAFDSGYGPGYLSGRGGSGTGFQSQTSLPAAKPATPKPPPTPTLPVNLRFRCEDCGHWYKEADLPKHKMFACPGKEATREADWLLMCECCDELDDAAAAKSGFPRPKPEPKVEAKPEAEGETKEEVVTAADE